MVNSLLVHQFNKDKHEIKGKKEKVSQIMIERDRRVMHNLTQLINNKSDKKEKVAKQRYRILAAYTKLCNKQFIIADKQRQSKDMKEDDLKKY